MEALLLILYPWLVKCAIFQMIDMYLPTDAAPPKVPFYSSSLLSPSQQRKYLDSNFNNDETGVPSTPRTTDPVACKLSYFLQPKQPVIVLWLVGCFTYVLCRSLVSLFVANIFCSRGLHSRKVLQYKDGWPSFVTFLSKKLRFKLLFQWYG